MQYKLKSTKSDNIKPEDWLHRLVHKKKNTFGLAFKIFICILAATSIKEFTALCNKGCVSRTCKTESLNYIDVFISTEKFVIFSDPEATSVCFWVYLLSQQLIIHSGFPNFPCLPRIFHILVWMSSFPIWGLPVWF